MMRRRSALLVGHLEGVSWRILEDYPKLIQGMIRGKSGVYALYKKSKLYYVGLASDLMGRLKNHLKDRHNKAWDRFSVYLTSDDSHLKHLESLVLRIVKPPPGNRVSGGFKGSASLYRELNRLMRQSDDDRRALYLDGSVAKNRRAKAAARQGSRGLAGLIERPIALRRVYKGKTYSARLLRSGQIRFAGKTFNSPTGAGRAIVGSRLNGWTFWTYEAAPRKWIPLQNLRARRKK